MKICRLVAPFLPAALLLVSAPPVGAGEKVLAEVGSEKITQAYLDAARSEFSRLDMSMEDDGRLLRHLVERKLLVLTARSILAESAGEVERRVAEREEASLAGFYREVEIDGKVRPVTEKEVEERFVPPSPTVAIRRLAFREQDHAEAFMADPAKDAAPFEGFYGEAAYENLTLPAKQIMAPLEEAIQGGKVVKGDWFGPVQHGDYHLVYELTAFAEPEKEATVKAREEHRENLVRERYKEREDAVWGKIVKRFNLAPNQQLIGQITSLGKPIRTYEDSGILFEYEGGKVSVGDYKDELRRVTTELSHPVFTRKALRQKLRYLMERLLYVKAAREDGLDRDPRFVAKRQLAVDFLWAGAFTSHVSEQASAQVTEQDPALRQQQVAKKTAELLGGFLEESRKANPVTYLDR